MRTADRVVLVLSILCGLVHARAEAQRYVVIRGGEPAGFQMVSRGEDGITRVEYTYSYNGLGPALQEEYELASDGTYATYWVKGTSRWGVPVDESFTRDADNAESRSTSEIARCRNGYSRRCDGRALQCFLREDGGIRGSVVSRRRTDHRGQRLDTGLLAAPRAPNSMSRLG